MKKKSNKGMPSFIRYVLRPTGHTLVMVVAMICFIAIAVTKSGSDKKSSSF